MFTRTSIVLAILFCTTGLLFGRLVNAPSYKQMAEHADLVVIATPTANADLPGPTTLPNVTIVDKNGVGREIPATRVETTFHTIAVLKGKLAESEQSFKLLHLKYVNPADANVSRAAQLMEFTAGDRTQYLMFLKLRDDGSYEPFNGQTDPIYSIEKLSQLARPNE